MTLNKSLFSSKTIEWETPFNLFQQLDETYRFTLDPCCTKKNAKCLNYFTKKENGLEQSWGAHRVFMNPPYGSEISEWVEKAALESKHNNTLVVGLLPARTDTRWFHNHIYGKAKIQFIRGRLKFGGSKNSAPFPSMIVIWGAKP